MLEEKSHHTQVLLCVAECIFQDRNDRATQRRRRWVLAGIYIAERLQAQWRVNERRKHY